MSSAPLKDSALEAYRETLIAAGLTGGNPGRGPRKRLIPRGLSFPVRFSQVAEAYERLEATAKRLEMTEILSGLLKATPPDVIATVVYLTQGRIAPDFEPIELGLAEKLALKALAQTAGWPVERATAVWKEKGDLGLVAQEIIAARAQSALATEPLTAEKVHENLLEIARASGSGSQDLKIQKLQELLAAATPLEARYLLRTVVGKMRLGVADMTVVDALAQAYATKEERDDIERAYNVSSDMGLVARTIAEKGMEGVRRIRLKVGVPLRAGPRFSPHRAGCCPATPRAAASPPRLCA